MTIHAVSKLKQQKLTGVQSEQATIEKKQKLHSHSADHDVISTKLEITLPKFNKSARSLQEKSLFETPPSRMSNISEEGLTHNNVLQNLLDESEAFDDTQKINVEKCKPKKVLPAVDTGIGARALWEQLQKESMKKLLEMDKKIPTDWKQSYGAYMRDNIAHDRRVIYRSFTDHQDVQDIKKLTDKRYQKKVKNIRHHSNIMFKRSEQNQNKTTLLLNNKLHTTQPIDNKLDSYFESLAIPPAPQPLDVAIIPETSEDSSVEMIPSKYENNLLFLTDCTEEDGDDSGQFRRKFTPRFDMKQVTDIPGFASNTSHHSNQLPPSAPPLRLLRHKHNNQDDNKFPRVPHTSHGHRSHNIDPKWQPLTMRALMDYTNHRKVLGKGSFNHGSAASSYWSPKKLI